MKDTGNICWKDLPSNVTVEDKGSSFIARYPNGDYKLIFWGSEDAVEAQRFLAKAALRPDSYKLDGWRKYAKV